LPDTLAGLHFLAAALLMLKRFVTLVAQYAEQALLVRDDFSLTLPIAVTSGHEITMGFDEDLDKAARSAVRSMLSLLQRYYGLTWGDAYRLVSVIADLRVTQLVNGAKGIHVMLSRDVLAQKPQQPPFLALT